MNTNNSLIKISVVKLSNNRYKLKCIVSESTLNGIDLGVIYSNDCLGQYISNDKSIEPILQKDMIIKHPCTDSVVYCNDINSEFFIDELAILNKLCTIPTIKATIQESMIKTDKSGTIRCTVGELTEDGSINTIAYYKITIDTIENFLYSKLVDIVPMIECNCFYALQKINHNYIDLANYLASDEPIRNIDYELTLTIYHYNNFDVVNNNFIEILRKLCHVISLKFPASTKDGLLENDDFANVKTLRELHSELVYDCMNNLMHDMYITDINSDYYIELLPMLHDIFKYAEETKDSHGKMAAVFFDRYCEWYATSYVKCFSDSSMYNKVLSYYPNDLFRSSIHNFLANHSSKSSSYLNEMFLTFRDSDFLAKIDISWAKAVAAIVYNNDLKFTIIDIEKNLKKVYRYDQHCIPNEKFMKIILYKNAKMLESCNIF